MRREAGEGAGHTWPQPVSQPKKHEASFISEIKCHINTDRIKEKFLKDSTQNVLKQTILRGWPNHRKNHPYKLHEYRNFPCNLVLDSWLHRQRKLHCDTEITAWWSNEVLKAIHIAHLKEVKSIFLARVSEHLPGLITEIKKMVVPRTNLWQQNVNFLTQTPNTPVGIDRHGYF